MRIIGSRGGAPRAKTFTASVPLTTGLLTTVSSFGLLAPVTFAKTGGNANLTLASNGQISAAAALTAGATQSLTGTATGSDGVVFPFTANLTGAVSVPAAPTVTLTAGNGQISIAWVDGSNGGAAITAHTIYVNGAAMLPITSASPYVLTGLANGVAVNIEVSATNSAGEGAKSAVQSATPSAAPVMPSGLVFRIDSSAITPQTDNTNITTVTDTINSIPFANASSTVKYRAAGGAGVNGKAYLEFSGAAQSYLNCPTGSQGALATALNSQEYTIMVVAQRTGASSSCCVFGPGGSGKVHMTHNGTAIGFFNSTQGGGIPFTSTAYSCWATTSTKTYKAGGASNAGSGAGALTRQYVRGMPFHSYVAAAPTVGTDTIGLGANGAGALPFIGRIYEVLVWNKPLSQTEMLQAEAVLNAKYSQTHPVVTKGKFLVLDGDSRTAGVGANNVSSYIVSNSFAYRTATALGFAPGEYAMAAVGGLSIQNCINKGAGEVDTIAAAFPTASPRLIYEEFFNSRALSVGTISTAGTMAYQTKQYFDGRRAGLGAGAKLVATSPVDHADVNTPVASTWANWIGAGKAGAGANNWPSLGADGIADVWANTALGGDSACPNTSPWTPWSDGVHLLGNGASDATDGQWIQAQAVATAAAAITGW